ncbi:hypothetical protein HXW73_03195 [Halomonas sp. SH5A2]|uniref:hypothetical protein n=1 Tax=Halomonas sp. SH5A2 TaxID=2749040 RepID=UPI001641144E|nr:hypothetical protein [Halomonas sp. SH5A2]QNI02020.1 hypothetical protein HXW73_03195 [Halomonas sp. SH5A2]
MKLKRFSFWPYVLVASLLSYLFFMLTGDYFSEDKEAVIGVSGFLIAGSWSFLSIETNKEVRRRDEIIRYLNEYEDAVLGFVHGTADFFHTFSKIKSFALLDGLSRESIYNKKRRAEFVGNDVQEHNSKYSGERRGELFDELVNQKNTLISKDNVVRIRGGLLKLCVSSVNEINEIEKLFDEAILSVRKTADKDNGDFQPSCPNSCL